MKFNIFNYNQKKAVELKLDLKDLLILDWFQNFQPKMNKIIHEQEQYYWINYASLIADIPIIEITTERGLYKRLMNLCQIGILRHITKRTNGGCYSYYLITDIIISLVSSESSSANDPKVQVQNPESSEYKEYNSSTINSSTINSSLGENSFSPQNPTYSEIPNNSNSNVIEFDYIKKEECADTLILDKKNTDNPVTAMQKKVAQTNTLPVSLTDTLTEDDKQAINLWLEYKKERRQAYKPKSIPYLIKSLREAALNSNATMREIVENSIANNYQGLFAIRKQQSTINKNYEQPKNKHYVDPAEVANILRRKQALKHID